MYTLIISRPGESGYCVNRGILDPVRTRLEFVWTPWEFVRLGKLRATKKTEFETPYRNEFVQQQRVHTRAGLVFD